MCNTFYEINEKSNTSFRVCLLNPISIIILRLLINFEEKIKTQQLSIFMSKFLINNFTFNHA